MFDIMQKYKCLLPLIVLGLLYIDNVIADSVTKDMQVKVKVNTACIFNDGDVVLDFGAVSPLTTGTAVKTANTNFYIKCLNGQAYSVLLNGGLHNSGSQWSYIRNMCLNNGPDSCFTYKLYQNIERTTEWMANSSLTGTGAGMSVPQAIGVYGSFTLTSSINPGDYADTVTITLSW